MVRGGGKTIQYFANSFLKNLKSTNYMVYHLNNCANIFEPIYCEGHLVYKFKYENLIKIKNIPDPDLSGGSYLFNEIKKRTPKSRETIPLVRG
jgi:hypothetical protein